MRGILSPLLHCWSDEEYGEKSVSVKVDDEEVELCFIDHPSNEMSVGDSSIRNIALEYKHFSPSG